MPGAGGGRGGVEFNGSRASAFRDKRHSGAGWWDDSSVNVLNATERCT